MRLTQRQIAYVLAALRYCQSQNLSGMSQFEDLKPLDAKEIDALCESLNVKESGPGRFTVVGLYPDNDWDSSMRDATFVQWVTARDTTEAAQFARTEMARIYLSGSDEPAEPDIEKEVPQTVQDFEVLCVFGGHLEDLY